MGQIVRPQGGLVEGLEIVLMPGRLEAILHFQFGDRQRLGQGDELGQPFLKRRLSRGAALEHEVIRRFRVALAKQFRSRYEALRL